MGKKIKKFEIIPLGFCLEIKRDILDNDKKILKGTTDNIKFILIAIAGPLVNFAIAFFCLLYRRRTQ